MGTFVHVAYTHTDTQVKNKNKQKPRMTTSRWNSVLILMNFLPVWGWLIPDKGNAGMFLQWENQLRWQPQRFHLLPTDGLKSTGWFEPFGDWEEQGSMGRWAFIISHFYHYYSWERKHMCLLQLTCRGQRTTSRGSGNYTKVTRLSAKYLTFWAT